MFSKIISYKNLEASYLEIIEQFSVDRRNFKYHGLDNLFLRDFDLKSQAIIKTIRADLSQLKEIEPALAVQIPKRNKPGEYREIFIYNLKERIKAQAIYRVVLPEFEKIFSPRLFSYRPGKPPYLAAQSFCRRYRRYFLNDQALIIDLKNYSDRIDRNLMFSQVQKIFQDQKIQGLLGLYIFNRISREGKFIRPEQGLVQGVPLIALLANLYLSDLDFKYQSKSAFYIRVGDDLAFLDPSLEKLQKIQTELSSDLEARSLVINKKKLFCGPADKPYSFLGYAFNSGIISLEENFINRVQSEWKGLLKYQHFTDRAKKNILQRIMQKPENNFDKQFLKIITDKSQINNSQQIKKMSENFFAILTKFFYKQYTPRNRRLVENILKDAKIISLYKLYKKFHYDRH